MAAAVNHGPIAGALLTTEGRKALEHMIGVTTVKLTIEVFMNSHRLYQNPQQAFKDFFDEASHRISRRCQEIRKNPFETLYQLYTAFAIFKGVFNTLREEPAPSLQEGIVIPIPIGLTRDEANRRIREVFTIHAAARQHPQWPQQQRQQAGPFQARPKLSISDLIGAGFSYLVFESDVKTKIVAVAGVFFAGAAIWLAPEATTEIASRVVKKARRHPVATVSIILTNYVACYFLSKK